MLPTRPKIWVAGCGRNQALITALKFPHAEVLGSDLSAESLADCRKNAYWLKVENLELRRESLNEVTYADRFDYVICTGVIHHNADPKVPLLALKKGLKPQGVMELMVYDTYHRLETAGFQEAVRRILGNLRSPDLELELPVAQKLVHSFSTPCRMKESLAVFRDPACLEAHFCDALLQPVEHSYTVAGLAELAGNCGLELLTFAIDQYSKENGAIDWNLELTEPSVRDRYFSLPDVERWQISNVMLQGDSPLLWFYLQRRDCSRPRKSRNPDRTGVFVHSVREGERLASGLHPDPRRNLQVERSGAALPGQSPLRPRRAGLQRPR